VVLSGLFALGDKQVSAAINAMHEQPVSLDIAGVGRACSHVAINLSAEV